RPINPLLPLQPFDDLRDFQRCDAGVGELLRLPDGLAVVDRTLDADRRAVRLDDLLGRPVLREGLRLRRCFAPTLDVSESPIGRGDGRVSATLYTTSLFPNNTSLI